MKKLLVIILASLYITGASGATVNLHYCMGQFAGWDLGHSEDNNCGSCGMDKKSGDTDNCCRDENKTIKLSDVHKTAEQFVNLIQVATDAQQHFPNYHPEVITSADGLLPNSNAPPKRANRPVYLLVRSIRI
jgi:hypothetical protein